MNPDLHSFRLLHRVKTLVSRVLLVLTSALSACNDVPPPADTVYLNGEIYTVESDEPWAEALAIQNGHYVFVGSSAEARKFVGDQTKLVDLGGAMAMPGIHDAHGHLLLGGMHFRGNCLLSAGADIAAIISELESCNDGNPPGNWLVAASFWSEQFPDAKPHRKYLDAAFPDTPVYLFEGSYHHALVNSTALEILGIDATTEPPSGGGFPIDETGELTGEIVEAATWIVKQHLPEPSPEASRAAMKWSADLYSRFGITSMQESAGNRQALAALNDLDASGDLNLNVAVHLVMESPTFGNAGLSALETLVEERRQHVTPHVSVDYVKMWIDGSPTPPHFTESGFDSEANQADLSKILVPPGRLEALLIQLDGMGIKVKMHVAGAGATHTALNAIAAARRVNPESEILHETGHSNLIIPTDFTRYKELRTVAELSPSIWHIMGDTLGQPPHPAWQFRTLLESGALITVGTDWPVTENPNLFPALQGMLEHGDESINLAAAVKAMTLNGATSLRREKSEGSIAVGKVANFIVLDRNLFEIPVSEIGATRVRRTVFEGRSVFLADPG